MGNLQIGCEVYSEICVGEHLSYSFPLQNSLKKYTVIIAFQLRFCVFQ
jgi:hypothetical protein